jgi:hypothetical protein
MSQTQNDSGIGTYQAGATITRGQRVAISLTTGKLDVAGGGVPLDLGIAMADAVADDFVSIAYVTKPGTFVASVTAAPITAGSPLYSIAGGQLSGLTTGSTVTWGIALEAASTNGSLIEVLRIGNA